MTNDLTGWLLDLYPHPASGIVLWLLCDDGQRRCLRQDFPVTFLLLGKITGCGIYGNFCPASRYKLSYHALNAKIYLQE